MIFAHKSARGAKFGDFFQKIVVRVKKKRQARREIINFQPDGNRRVNISDAVGERESDFLRGGRTGFADVITGNRNRVPVRHFRGAKSERVGDQPQGRFRRINISSARDVFLQNIVLNRAVDFIERDVLLSRDGQIKTQKRRSRRVDRHRSRNLSSGIPSKSVSISSSESIATPTLPTSPAASSSSESSPICVGKSNATRQARSCLATADICNARSILRRSQIRHTGASSKTARDTYSAARRACMEIRPARRFGFVINIRICRVKIVRQFDARRSLKFLASFLHNGNRLT